jgi:hypothetical protein
LGRSPHERLHHFAWQCTAADEYVVQKDITISINLQGTHQKGELQAGVSDFDQYLRSLMFLGSKLDFLSP